MICIILLIIVVLILYPLLYIVSLSVSDPGAVSRGEVTFLPVDFTLDTYKYVLQDSRLGSSYINSIVYAVTGTLSSVVFTGLMAYPLSVSNFSLKKPLTIIIMITMYFSGGMIPTYMVIKNLGFIDTLWAIIMPGAVSAYNVIIYRTFFSSIPTALRESAVIDGAGHLKIYYKIILPLSKPLIATMSLFSAVGLWNNYFEPLIYLNDYSKQPLSLLLRQMVIQLEFSNQNMKDLVQSLTVNTRTIRAATMLAAMLPIMCVYPFLQKYFTSGMMLGSVKG